MGDSGVVGGGGQDNSGAGQHQQEQHQVGSASLSLLIKMFAHYQLFLQNKME